MRGEKGITTRGWIVIIVIVAILSSAATYFVTAPPPKKIKLRITYGSPWETFIGSAADDFEKAHPNVELVRESIPKDFDKKVTIDLAAGVAGDILLVDSYLLPEYVEAGYLHPFTDYVAEWPAWDEYYPIMKEIVTVDEVPYGIMTETDVRGVWYWKPNMKKAGISIPWQPKTWDDLLDAAEKLKNAGVECPMMTELGSTWGEGSTMQSFYMLSLGATKPVMGSQNRLRDWEAGKWIGKSPAILKSFEIINEILEKGYMLKKYTIGDVWALHREATRNGKVGLNLGGMWEWNEFWPKELRPTEAERKDLLGFAKMPGKEEDGNVTISGGWLVSINKETTHPDLAWEYIQTLLERDRHAKWLIKGMHISPRADALEVSEYAANEFMSNATTFMDFATYRDTYPGYSKVSIYNQEAIDKLIGGELTPSEAMDFFYNKLVEEFGADKVKTIT